MTADRYRNFAALAASEIEGVNYAIRLVSRSSSVAIVAPHGGWIEPTTSSIAAAVAGSRHNLYCFEGIGPARDHHELHITSHRFDEPQALALVRRCKLVLTVHGHAGTGKSVLVGGLDAGLKRQVAAALRRHGLPVRTSGHDFPATNPLNICNRGKRRGGVQLEFSRALRDRLAADGPMRRRYARAIREGIEAQLASQ